MMKSPCPTPAAFKLRIIVALVASAIAGGVHAQATVSVTGTTENDVAVNVNTDDASAGAFIVYSGSGTTNVMASIGALTGTTFTALTGGTAATPGPIGGQLQVTSTGVNVSVGALTVAGDAVATEGFVTSQGYATTSAMNSADSGLQTQIDNRVVIGSSATLNGLNNSGGGITNAGAIGASSLNAGAGAIQTTGTVSGGTGMFATLSGTTMGGTLNAAGNNITNVGTLNATTGNITTLNSSTINNSGNVGTATLSTSGLATLNSASVTNGLTVGGTSTLNGATTINNTLNVTGTTTTAGINNTGTLNQTGTSNINTSGAAATNIGNAASTTTIVGATNINNTGTATTNIGTAGGATNLGNASSTNTVLGTTSVTGATSINTTGSSATSIGAVGNTSAVTMTSGASNIQVSNGTTTINGTTNNITGTTNINLANGATTNIATTAAANTNIGVLNGTNTIAGTTSINASVNNATNLNTGTSTGAVTIGNANNTSNLNSAVNNIGVSSGYATSNNIGTNAANASANVVGNTNSGSTVTEYAGNSSLSLVNGTASLRSGSGATASGFTATSAAQTLSSTPATLATQLNGVGDAASRQNIAGASYVNRIEGNTLINGNTYINGTLVYTSNTSASTTVTSGVSILGDATQATNGQNSIANTGASGAVVDTNGRITTGIVGQSTASMTLTNGVGNTHGLVVTETQATMSGGTYSSSMTLNDNGTTFSNSANGAPIQVHGVADGTSDFDAVNYRQLRRVVAGVAGTAAMANIPQVDQEKTFAVGAGLGNFQGMTALALGVSYRPAPNTVMKASVSTVGGIPKSTVVGVGAGFSW